jgi:tRNA pseudouridine55 synthase
VTQPPAPGDEPREHRDGLLVIDKPAGWSSHDVVARVRRLAGTRRVGHAGTLDPMATGVLVLGLNRATRLLHYLVGSDKEYSATIRLGQSTLTDDAEGETTASPGAALVEEGELQAAVAGLTGEIEQVPSAVSAVKVGGRRAYARVRSGEEVALRPRAVTVHRFELLGRRSAVAEDRTPVTDVDVLVDCSSGTYVRALARDLGAALGTGGHLVALRRTKVGPFTLGEAVTLDDLAPQDVPLLDVTTAARRCFPVRRLSDDEATALRYGRPIAPGGTGEEPVGAIGPDGRLVALLVHRGAQDERPPRAQPVLVLDPA